MIYELYKKVEEYQGVEDLMPYRRSFSTPFFVFSLRKKEPVQPVFAFGVDYGEWSNFTTVSC